MTAIRLADLEPEEETQFDLADLGASLSTSPTYVPPTPMLSFARAITSPQPKVAAGKGAPWARSSGRGQPPPAELPRGITIGHEMGKTVRSRIVDEDDEVDEDSAAYVYHRSSSRPSSAFGLLGEDDRLQGWNFVEKQPLAPGSTEESGKKKGKGKKIVLVSNGGMRRK